MSASPASQSAAAFTQGGGDEVEIPSPVASPSAAVGASGAEEEEVPEPTINTAASSSSAAPDADAPAASAEPEAKTCIWTPKDDEKMLDVFEDAQRQNKQSGGGFKPEVYKKVEEAIAPLRKKGLRKGVKEVKSHWRNLKTQWKQVKELVELSGFGWNEETGTVTADDDVWDELIKRQPKFKKWRNRPFVHYKRVDSLCAKSTATGSFARDGKEKGKEKKKAKKSAKEGEGEAQDDDDDDGDGSDSDSDDDDDLEIGSRKRKRPSAVSAIADIASALKDIGSQDEGLGDALAEVLERDSDVFDEEQLALLGMALAEKPLLAAVYRSYAEKEELRRKFLHKVLQQTSG